MFPRPANFSSLPYNERMALIKQATISSYRNMTEHEGRSSNQHQTLSLVPVTDSFESKQNVYNTLQRK